MICGSCLVSGGAQGSLFKRAGSKDPNRGQKLIGAKRVQYPKTKKGHENTNDVQTHTQKHKYFYMLFVYTQMSLDGGVKPHERCFKHSTDAIDLKH